MKTTRTERLIQIIRILQAGRRCDVNSLAGLLKVSRRTVIRDVKMLREAGFECDYDIRTESYCTSRASFLQPLSLTLEEGLALMLLTRKFVDERVMPSADSAVSAGLKIESVLPADVQAHCGRLLEGVEVGAMRVSDVDTITDLLLRIQHAVAGREKLSLEYDSYYEQRKIDTILRPYVVTFQNRGWYVVGHSEMHDDLRTFKIERINRLENTNKRFSPAKNFDLESYLGNAWNMIRGDGRFHVEVRFSRMVAGNVEEVMWHKTQRTRRRSDGSLVFEVDVDGIDEIAWWVLGYGDQAVVTEPEALRRLIASHAVQLTQYYKNGLDVPVSRA